MQIRRDNLEASLLYHQWARDLDDELQWLVEKEPQAASADLGNTLTAVSYGNCSSELLLLRILTSVLHQSLSILATVHIVFVQHISAHLLFSDPCLTVCVHLSTWKV